VKTLGVIGGIGPESTIDYYRLIIALYREQRPDGSYPSIVINSINLKKMLDLVAANELVEVVRVFVDEIHRLARAGADFGLIASNTPHIVFDEICCQSPLPLVSIVEVTCNAAKALGHKTLGLFGTRFTMQGGFYATAFSKEGISVVAPNQEEQAYIHDKYLTELIKGVFLPETRERLLGIVDRLKERHAIDGLILGGTELPLILRTAQTKDVPFLDTTQIHVKAAVAELLS
jgi:aspartate racemase